MSAEPRTLVTFAPRHTGAAAMNRILSPADMQIPKSYINCTEDTALPHSLPYHPRLSEKLGLYRLVQTPGSHEICFTNPELLGRNGPTPNRWTVKCLCFLSSPKSLWSQKLPLRRRRRGVAACPAR